MSYFLLSVSNRKNLLLCIKHGMAGFTNSINGAWTFVEINEGDFVSFLYGAKIYNLYKVKQKIALKDAQNIPPWPSVTFSTSGKTYYFPFRLLLEPIRELEEPLVRAEFSYVAENLLLRGGYRRTHFQADQTTLQAVSQMGTLFKGTISTFDYSSYSPFVLRFTKNKSLLKTPEVFQLKELILQSLIRQYLLHRRGLKDILSTFCPNMTEEKLEVLGEKALPEGHIDLLIKEATPIGGSRKIIMEVKTSNVTIKDINQVHRYMEELGDECIKGLLVGAKFSKKSIDYARSKNIGLIAYSIDADLNKKLSFEQILNAFRLTCLS